MDRGRLAALVVAVGATALVAATPIAGLSPAGRFAVATMAFAAICWVTEALPLPVTALLVPVLLSIFGVFPTLAGAFTGFADPVIFLLLAGFVLARALQRHGVDRLVAFGLLVRIGTSPRRLVLAVMVATAGLSMLISNSATTAMMAPIALGLADQTTPADVDDAASTNIGVALLLGTAYAASLGGLGTVVGSPPNAIVVAQLDRQLGYHLSFADWLVFGIPLVIVTIPIAWLLLIRIYPPELATVDDARRGARSALAASGGLSPPARRVIVIAALTAGLWVLGGLGFLFEGVLSPAVHTTLFGGAGPTVFGTIGNRGLLHFTVVGLLAIPALVLAGTIDRDDLLAIDWGTILLLGGGLALANALASTDATSWLTAGVVGLLADAPILVVVLGIVTATVALSELASNTATAAILAPILIGLGPRYAPALGTGETTASVFLAVTAAIAGSFGFALPVATPPNAIAFGTGRLSKDDMLRAGVALDVLMILVGTAILLGLFVLLSPP